MQCLVFLLTLSLGILSALAAECTSEQLAVRNNQSYYEKIESDCAAALSAAKLAVYDPKGTAEKICGDTKCLTTLQGLLRDVPNCSVNGENTREVIATQFAGIQATCKTITGKEVVSVASTLSSIHALVPIAIAAMALLAQV